LPPTYWAGASIGKYYRPLKTQISLRIDNEVLAWLKSKGEGHLSRINEILRERYEQAGLETHRVSVDPDRPNLVGVRAGRGRLPNRIVDGCVRISSSRLGWIEGRIEACEGEVPAPEGPSRIGWAPTGSPCAARSPMSSTGTTTSSSIGLRWPASTIVTHADKHWLYYAGAK